MGTFTCGRRLRLLLLLVCVNLGLFALAGVGTASAAIPPSGTVSPGTSVSWQGQYYAMASVADPTLCPPQAADPGNLVCDHFQLTPTASGLVTVSITAPSPACQSNPTNPTPIVPCDTSGTNDFDLLVCQNNIDPNTINGNCLGGTMVAYSNNAGSNETVTFSAVANTTYEVRVIPSFVVNSDYQGTASMAAVGGGRGEGDDISFFHRERDEFNGAGETEDHGKFSEHGDDDHQGHHHGKARYRNDDEHCNFYSTQASSVSITRTALDLLTGRQLGVLHMEGQGYNYGKPVTFQIDSVDNGDGTTPSTFVITTSDGCHGGGNVSGGSQKPKYKHRDAD